MFLYIVAAIVVILLLHQLSSTRQYVMAVQRGIDDMKQTQADAHKQAVNLHSQLLRAQQSARDQLNDLEREQRTQARLNAARDEREDVYSANLALLNEKCEHLQPLKNTCEQIQTILTTDGNETE